MAEGDAELQDLYREVLIDYFRDPAFKGDLPDAEKRLDGANPICGDELKLALKRENGGIIVRHLGRGCVISQASAAMMCEALQGKPVDEARELIGAFKSVMVDGKDPETLPEDLEELKALEGVRKFPIRIKCALLAWNTLLQGLDENGRKP